LAQGGGASTFQQSCGNIAILVDGPYDAERTVPHDQRRIEFNESVARQYQQHERRFEPINAAPTVLAELSFGPPGAASRAASPWCVARFALIGPVWQKFRSVQRREFEK
jgi:hypothetical protein